MLGGRGGILVQDYMSLQNACDIVFSDAPRSEGAVGTQLTNGSPVVDL